MWSPGPGQASRPFIAKSAADLSSGEQLCAAFTPSAAVQIRLRAPQRTYAAGTLFVIEKAFPAVSRLKVFRVMRWTFRRFFILQEKSPDGGRVLACLLSGLLFSVENRNTGTLLSVAAQEN